MERRWALEESIEVSAGADEIYALLSDVRRLARWSPECFTVRAAPGPARVGGRFTGWNRRRFLVWFTDCRITAASPGSEFAFAVTVLGLPVALWGYRLTPEGSGRTTVTEYWRDMRTGRGAWITQLLGLLFTGTRPGHRHAVNRRGMRETLRRLKLDAEGRGPGVR